MARKKAEGESKQNNPVSYRLSAASIAVLDRLAEQHQITKTAVLEAALHHLDRDLAKGTFKDAKAAIDSKKKIPRDGP